ncbi:twin-arginine translocase TatA/TatE family subunit [Conexivisphaera calida]|uniref:Twin-arginine translocation protein TatA n=1 Tax=Conexivisphaera calida TaxID=1874277 RepID=A0A4P2VDW0_9ARCH|nr:twin-arginine translocase TatA/TatE family subunit [Conexivisphaera calida]BBE42257.1 Twin-arginine translocation protein TatA [Conexivisphaera calida]
MLDSATDLIIVIIVAVVLFAGANKIPEIFHSFGRAVGEYKKGKVESEMELSRIVQVSSQAPAQTSSPTGSAQAAPSGSAGTDEKTRQLEAQIAELQRQLQEIKSKGGN